MGPLMIEGLLPPRSARTPTMTDPTSCVTAGCYCQRCDLLVDLPGFHVTDVERDPDGRLLVTVESAPTVMGCPVCGVVAHGHGRTVAEFVDAPSFGHPVRLRWRKRRWLCPEPMCAVDSFVEQDPAVALPGRLLTIRAIRWATGQLRGEQASIEGLSRQLGTTWRTLWRAIRPVLEAAAEDEARFDGVSSLGVDEHIWHHVSPLKRGPKELTGMVDLTRHPHPRTGKVVVKARLLDLVPGRSGTVYKSWRACQVDCVSGGGSGG